MIRPPLLTAVGIICLAAGVFPLLEVVAVLTSPTFSNWFMPLLLSLMPVSPAVVLGLLPAVAAFNITLGVGVWRRKGWAIPGIIFRAVIAAPLDYINYEGGNRTGGIFGLIVSVFTVWAVVTPKSHAWFRE